MQGGPRLQGFTVVMAVKKKNTLATNLAGIAMNNPVMVCSGTFGYGEEYSELLDVNKLGAIVTKTITLKPREGNPVPRILETASGIINSIGLQNVGIEKFIEDKLPFLEKLDTRIIVSIAGGSAEEFAELAKILDSKNIDGIELNLSCPNVKGGAKSGKLFAQDCNATFRLVKKARKATSKPVIVKLSPNVTDIGSLAKTAESAGADGISLVNTFQAMAIDVDKRKPVMAKGTGGLSGPCIKPIAVRMVWEAARSVKLPVIGMGGIMNARDALEFIIAGARAVSVGTGLFADPEIPFKIINGLQKYLSANNINHISKLCGTLKYPART